MQVSLEDKNILTAIEFSVESRINLESDEQVTIIAHPDLIEAIKIAIAKGLIFQKIYPRLILNRDTSLSVYDMIIIPDRIIEDMIQEDIQKELTHNEEVKSRLAQLNEKMSTIPEEQLIRISQTPEEELTSEELNLKNEIQFAMLDVGMNIELQFSDPKKQEEKVESVLDKVLEADKVQKINLEGVIHG